MMYHAQERIVNLPGSEVTGQRGGSTTRLPVLRQKPTHMIGGYGHRRTALTTMAPSVPTAMSLLWYVR